MIGPILLLALALMVIALGIVAVTVRQLVRPPRKSMAVALGRGEVTEPGDLGLTGEDVVFTLSDGTTSPGLIVEGQLADGPTALILHGYRDWRYDTLHRAQFLAPHVRRCVAFDLPGHGEAQARTPTYGRREPDDILAVLHQLTAPGTTPDPEPVLIYGYSMGAQLALHTAAKYPHAFLAVMAACPYRERHTPLDGFLRRQHLPGRLLSAPSILAGELMFGTADHFDRAEDAAALQCPLMVFHGDADDVCPIEDGRAIAQAANASIVEFPGARHVCLYYEDPERFTAELAGFLGSLPRRV